jgi:ABC-type antimicrobial peptide transport system permease subunit
MLGVRLLPWEYGVRNLFRRPLRSLLTLIGLTLSVLLVFVVVGFIRGLEGSLSVSGDPRVVIVHSLGNSENLENSSVPNRTPALLTASLEGIQRWHGTAFASGELYLGTLVSVQKGEPSFGLVRGVTPTTLLVRRQVQITEGRWPGPGEVLVGRLAATKLGKSKDALAIGQTVNYEGRDWRVSGVFAARGSTLESELWCPLDELQQAMKRQDLTVVAVTLAPGATFGDVEEFCKERLDLELEATPETTYYASLNHHYRPVRALAWLIAILVAGAGAFTGLNTMYGAVVGRVRELATLQALGYDRWVIGVALIQEAVLLAAAGSLIASLIALVVLNDVGVRFTMGAFTLRVDSVAIAIGAGSGLLLGILGAVPPALKAMRMPVVEGLKAV